MSCEESYLVRLLKTSLIFTLLQSNCTNVTIVTIFSCPYKYGDGGMRTLMRGRLITVVMAIGMVIVSITGCGGEPDNAVTISYTLPIAPITFSFDTDGHISVSVSAEIVTELGELQVSAGSAITPFATSAPDNVLILTIRHKEDGNLVDTGYQIDTTGVGSADVQGDISEVH